MQATHKYTGEDVDELNFDPEEIIFVIEFENPEEQVSFHIVSLNDQVYQNTLFP